MTAPSRRADPERALDWLSALALRHGGALPSWQNPAHPGYAYPEAAGLALTALAQPRPRDPAVEPMARWLLTQVDARGLVGRGGVAYVFDTAMALTGLLCARRAGVALDPAALAPMLEAILAAIADRRACDDPQAPPRWSTRWSCHQLKLAWSLIAWDEDIGDARVAPALAALSELAALEHDGRFALRPDDARSYVHASCYALEGSLALVRRGIDVATNRARLRRGADWLTSIQAEDGSLPCWIGEGSEVERRPSDVIAQALRIWAVVDPGRHAEPIARARAALARRQHPSGGLRYLEASDDVNSWCSAFASQALRWAEDEARDTSLC
ncbi:hypothetical protein G6O69_22825 [Pseudenhygromyxa sp. WMMC2535]|uniref:hypothetical protein n=1 Tax=Pseudenhygromyxa sp. WMMC2535 TaxID=2712867 RepID=UPI0015579F95|nr:hypothetical protein [Pseudenhygromyxa sp. WMMC2535]NVB40691.1 hypothetical protein [Pseudenhygromyxa sp. WMMC2535]